MNEARRKEIDRAFGLIEEAKSIIEQAGSDERDYYDNMPENMQSGEKGDKAQEAADALDEATQTLDDVLARLEEAKS